MRNPIPTCVASVIIHISRCDKSHFNLLELDVDPERACCQLHEGLGVGSCAEELEALECADSVGRHRCLCF